MIFETLHDSSKRGELMLVDGGMCHWHLRQDGQLTIREIISTKQGAGSQMLRRLELIPGAESLFAKCPADLPANQWYAVRGFHVETMEIAKSGRKLLHWRKFTQRNQRRANAGQREIIYCADGNPRFAEIAIDAGMLYGARLPAKGLYYQPYMADQDWKQPDRVKYMAWLAEHQPYMATVLDLERPDQLTEVLEWAHEAAQYVRVVIIIPKYNGAIVQLPRQINDKAVRLGYSVPTTYGGTTVPINEFEGWPVHLLGGSPVKQLNLSSVLDVRSADTNYHSLMANYGEYFDGRRWRELRDDGTEYDRDVPYEAFHRSCGAIMTAWRAQVQTPVKNDFFGLPMFQGIASD